MLTYVIRSGSTSHLQDNLLRGQLPKLVIVGLVPSADFEGTTANTPLRFKALDLTQISLQRDGHNVPYSRAIEMDWTSGKELVTFAYATLIQNLRLFNVNSSNGITLDDFMDKWALYAFDLTPDLNVGGDCGQPAQTANLRLETKFGTALTASVNVIVMSIRDGRVEISKQRQVFKTG